MSGPFFDELAALAVEMLNEFGASAQLTRTSVATTSYDPATDRTLEVPGTVQTLTVKAIVGPWTWEDDEGREVTRSTVTMLGKPAQGDRLVQGSMTYTIGRVTTVAPQGEAILYLAEVS